MLVQSCVHDEVKFEVIDKELGVYFLNVVCGTHLVVFFPLPFFLFYTH